VGGGGGAGMNMVMVMVIMMMIMMMKDSDSVVRGCEGKSSRGPRPESRWRGKQTLEARRFVPAGFQHAKNRLLMSVTRACNLQMIIG
jgi:hypothetical protein